MSSLPTTQDTPAPFQVPQTPVEADDAYDADSSFGSEAGGSSLNYGSVTSSIYQYRVENGRTYHAYSDGKYMVPNDEKEQERMDILYHAILTVFGGKAFFAPVKNPQRIVDIGTGTGIWALDVGDEYPEAHVIGIDLSPIQPKWTATNVEFRVDDLEKPWVFNSPLDFVHSRMCSGNAIRSWEKYLAEAYRTLRPGGWVESQDAEMRIQSDDDSIPENSKVKQWHELTSGALTTAGYNMLHTSAEIKKLYEEAGFINVVALDFKLPIAPWPKDKALKVAGSAACLSCVDNLSGMSIATFTRILGWDIIEFELFIRDVKKEWLMKGVHAYWPMSVVYGQKPESSEEKVEVEITAT